MSKSLTVTVESLLQELRTTYTGAVSALDKERLDLEREAEGIQKAADKLRLLLPAQARVAERAADDLLLAGKHEEAQAKREEKQQAEAAPEEMEQRRRAIAARLESIEAEKRDNACSVFDAWLPTFRAVLVEDQRDGVDALEAAWAGIQSFAAETGAYRGSKLVPLATEKIRLDLTARDSGPEKVLFFKLLEWFGGKK